MNRYTKVRELVKDPSLTIKDIAQQTGYDKGHVSRLRKESMRQAEGKEHINREPMKHIKTWNERCEEHPDHQQGMISEGMIRARMQEEIDELRQALRMFQQPTKIFGPSLEEILNSAGFYRKREWVGLTDDEVAQAMYRADAIITGPMQFRFAKEIEAKLKEKNHG